MTCLIELRIDDPSQISEARRRAAAYAINAVHFDETMTGRLSIIITELGTNLLKHARGGVLLLRALTDEGLEGVEILAIDKGPGMADLQRCLSDGYSTAGSQGQGLGAIRRQATLFDIYTQPGRGTAIVVRLQAANQRANNSQLQIGALSLPKRDEEVCGDGWAIGQEGDRTLIMVADGLGHGAGAHESSQKAINIFKKNLHYLPTELIALMHEGLRGLRGAAVAISMIANNQLHYAGVGNISGVIITHERNQYLPSYNGTAGLALPRLQNYTCAWPSDALLVMNSDGLQSQWKLGAYAGLLERHPSLTAAVLYRDFNRGRDDTTIVAVKLPTRSAPPP